MKRTIPIIALLLIFTVIFIFAFRSCAYASELVEKTDEAYNGELENEENPGGEIANGEIANEEAEEEKAYGKEEFDLKNYIQEKILPVVIGVLTAASALIATLVSISRSLGKIKDARDEFKKEAKEREKSFKAQSDLLKTKADELLKIAGELPKLKGEISSLQETTDKLILECTYISKMISLGFGEDKNVVKSGNGARISKLEGECSRLLASTGKEA